MKTLTSRIVVSAKEDWLDSCVLKARHETFSRSTATLIQRFEKPVVPPPPAQRITFPLIEHDFGTVIRPPSTHNGHRPARQHHPAAKQTKTTNLSLSGKKPHRLPDPLEAELHSFRQLSSPLFCPETSLDTLPEYILFGLIVLLAAAWPILAMIGVMARS
jgi:hypothetical protein